MLPDVVAMRLQRALAPLAGGDPRLEALEPAVGHGCEPQPRGRPRGSYSELAVTRLEFGSDAGHCSPRAAGELPLACESGRELGGEADNCVSSVAGVSSTPVTATASPGDPSVSSPQRSSLM